MQGLDFNPLKGLLNQYIDTYKGKLTTEERDLCNELGNLISDLENHTQNIINLIHELLPEPAIIASGDSDIIDFMGFRLSIKRANPAIPIAHDNTTIAFERKGSNETQKKLYGETELFYHRTYRIHEITKLLPGLEKFKCKSVLIVCNELLKHAGHRTKVTYDSFGYSTNEGPFVKALRKDEQTESMDKGFYNNAKDFLSKLEEMLKSVI
jgi:hypothetical protein